MILPEYATVLNVNSLIIHSVYYCLPLDIGFFQLTKQYSAHINFDFIYHYKYILFAGRRLPYHFHLVVCLY